jgi:hypothetical protein
MGRVTRASVGGMVALSLVMCSGAGADVTDERIRAQLTALKELCDKGLISPEVCAEKQRDILGLTPRMSTPPARAGGPRLRGGPPAAPRAKDARGPASPAPGAKPSAPLPAPGGSADAPSGGLRESALGFRMSLPDGWTRVSSEDMRKGFAQLADQVADNPEARRVWERLVDSAEVYMREGEQLTVQSRAGTVPRNAADSEKLCQTLKGTLARLPSSKPLTTYECRLLEIGGVTTLFVDQQGLAAGTRTMQIWLEREPGKVLQFALSFKDDNVEPRRKELTDIVASVRW